MSVAFNLTPERALALWADRRASFQPGITQAVTAALPMAQIVEGILDVILHALIAEAPRAWAWLHRQLAKAGERIDGALTWERIRNDELREWLEARDNPYDLLQRSVKVLSEAIEADVETVEGERLLSLVGGGAGRAAGFFPDFNPRTVRAVERQPSTEVVVREPTAEEQLAEAEAIILALKAEVDHLTEALEARALVGELVVEDDAPEAVLVEEPTENPIELDLEPPDIVVPNLEPEDAPEPASIGDRARRAMEANPPRPSTPAIRSARRAPGSTRAPVRGTTRTLGGGQ